ncbi:hypothetical protein Hdeb2414_s1110g00983001 [Helianthus debilis subsp. tardiflorus]
MLLFNIQGINQFTMTTGHPKYPKDVSTSTASTSAEKRKEYNRRYYASRKANKKVSNIFVDDVSQNASFIPSRVRVPTPLPVMDEVTKKTQGSFLLKLFSLLNLTYFMLLLNTTSFLDIQFTMTTGQLKDRNDVSTSTTCTSSEKRKEYNRRYYLKRKDSNKVSKLCSDDVSQIDSLTPSRIQQSTLLPQFCGVANQPYIPVQNIEEDPYSFVYGGMPREHRVLEEQSSCPHCGAKRFAFEFPTFCCMSGKTVLANSTIPNELYQLFTSQDDIGKMFRQNIRAYNTNFSFTSMGVTLDDTMANMRDGVYTFRAHKGMYHRIDQLVPRDGTPRYLQLYFYDPDTELDHRLRWPNLDRNITEVLTRVLSTNPYVKTFRSLAELGPLDNYRVTLNTSVELDQRVYNRPTTSEV